MPLSYEDSSALMADTAFRGRVKVACMKYSTYINDEPSNTPGHSSRIRWSQQTMVNPDAAAATVTPTVVMDGAVQEEGAAIDDPGLQSATENAINKML